MAARLLFLGFSASTAGRAVEPSNSSCSSQQVSGLHLIQIAGQSAIVRAQAQGTCGTMRDVEKLCSDDGCKVLASNMRGKTCDEYCTSNGRTCVGAWEEVNEDCNIKATITCEQTWGTTSDLLCECSADADEESLTSASCAGLRDVERTCSADGCKVLADRMRGRTCRDYCRDNGLACAGAWEEVDEDCNVKATLTCDQTWDTSDLICECAQGPPSQSPLPSQTPAVAPSSGLKLVWSDEFDTLDTSKWSLVSQGGGFGNKELQYYRSSTTRASGGVLRIVAKCESYKGHRYTSAKLYTKHKASWGPGHRIEVRAKVPQGKGAWPAIWMLPVTKSYGGWPHSGEIDIMESVGCTKNKSYGTVHTGAYNHMKNTEKGNKFSVNVGDWHTYAVEWTASQIEWFVDGQHYHTFSPNSQDSEKWPFNKEFYLILNVAVGGTWGGYCLNGRRPSCSSSSEFGQDQVMEVDFARIYAL